MKDNIIVSIIIAIYNGEKYIKECLDSVLKQTYKNLEIILVDDGSTDNSGKLCDGYAEKDKRIKVIHQKNGGVSLARNRGLTEANGDYVCIVDQDDWLSLDCIEYLVKLVKENNAEIAVVPNVIYASNNRKVYSETRKVERVDIWSNEQAACEMLYSKMEIGPWSKIVSRELLMNNNIKFHIGIYGGDGYAFSVESFMSAKKIAVGYKGVYYYRVDNYTSEMSKFRPRTLQCSLKAVDIMYDEFNEYSKRMSRATKYAKWRVYVAFLNNLVASKLIKDFPEEYKVLIKNSRKYAYRSFTAEVRVKRKIKDLLYFVSPLLVAKINVYKNNKRDFNKGDN